MDLHGQQVGPSVLPSANTIDPSAHMSSARLVVLLLADRERSDIGRLLYKPYVITVSGNCVSSIVIVYSPYEQEVVENGASIT